MVHSRNVRSSVMVNGAEWTIEAVYCPNSPREDEESLTIPASVTYLSPGLFNWRTNFHLYIAEGSSLQYSSEWGIDEYYVHFADESKQ